MITKGDFVIHADGRRGRVMGDTERTEYPGAFVDVLFTDGVIRAIHKGFLQLEAR